MKWEMGDNRFRPAVFLIAILLPSFLLACSSTKLNPDEPDIRLRLLNEAKRGDPDFPNGHEVKLTHFGYVGTVDTAEGKIFIVYERGVIAGMLCPRGLNYLMFFDQSERYLGKVWLRSELPLWCDNGKVFLFGSLMDIRGEGNALDLSAGFGGMRIVSEKAYGSSGGIED